MCTAAVYQTKDFYFGRNLDFEFSYGDEITITPRNYPFHFRNAGTIPNHYAMIGMAHVADNYPLYYDAVNEKGLGIAGLRFAGNCVYQKEQGQKEDIPSFELIPLLLSQCASVDEAEAFLKNARITDFPFSEQLPSSPLHWLLADASRSVTLECVEDGLHLYENPAGVLTNNPPFPQQCFRLNDYMHLTPASPENTFCNDLDLNEYSRGMGAIGLPGDLSSSSRFVRAAFVKGNSVSGDSEAESVSQFFHILGSVEQQRGCCRLPGDKYEITIYTSCCNTNRGIYYYNTYENHQICAVDMHRENLDTAGLFRYPLLTKGEIRWQN